MKQLVEFLINNKSTGIIKTKNDDFVDLGLDVLWAKCNIGAKEPEDIGNYYQWGGLEPMNNKDCNWENDPFNNGNNYFDEKYFNSIKNKVCPNNILSKEHDIAYQTYNDIKVHIPTYENFVELIKNTRIEYIENKDFKGCMIFDKNNYFNHICIPSSGYKVFDKINLSSDLYLWSSNFEISRFCHSINLYADIDSGDIYCSYINLSNGMPVRAVKEK